MGQIKQNKIITHVQYIQSLYPKHFKNVHCSFGGNGKMGGLNTKSFKKLSEIMQFAYMGAAEYEGSKLPQAFLNMQSNHKQGDELTLHQTLINNKKVYVLSNLSLIKDSVEVVKEYYRQQKDFFLKTPAGFPEAIKKLPSPYYRSQGWIDIGHYNYMFFTNKSMAIKTKDFLVSYKGKF